MARTNRVISSWQEAEKAIAATVPGEQPSFEVVIVDTIPSWLREVVDLAEQSGARLTVTLTASDERDADASDGWEIGVLTVILGWGIVPDDVKGVDARRVRRVQAVIDQLAGASRPSTAASSS